MSGHLDIGKLSAAARALRASAYRWSLERRTLDYGARRPQWITSRVSPCTRRTSSSVALVEKQFEASTVDVNQYDYLNPQPPDYSSTPFIDACNLTLVSGAGGHGCVSFLREKYIENGPPNGGDGGTGGNIYIQAVRGETSLHKIARRKTMRAGRGKNGQGGSQGGKKGEDVLIEVPVGTVIREIRRSDPVAEELGQTRRSRLESAKIDGTTGESEGWRKHWLLYPGTLPETFTAGHIPKPPKPRQSNLAMTAPASPIRIDLDRPMSSPMLLAAGAMGGLGNPHFTTKFVTRPKYATKGYEGVTLDVQLELKLLADVGLVGLPNAGKSTLLRALTASRARIGNWAFTTLAPNIGTVVLDSSSGPAAQVRQLRDAATGTLRTHFTIADIPGLIEDAHLDKGLGLGFLRHIERARALAFVIDLSAGDAVQALKALWAELHMYERMRDSGSQNPLKDGTHSYNPESWDQDSAELPPLQLPPISSKPWLVVATKADLDATQENFVRLRQYLASVVEGEEPHPSGKPEAWTTDIEAVPVCAKQQENTEAVLDHLIKLLGKH